MTPLTAIVTTDLAAITRGRFVPDLDRQLETGVGWLPANLSLTPFNGIANPNPWGSQGDLRLIPDAAARYTTHATGSATPFDMVMGNLVQLDGTPWPHCPRGLLKRAVAELEAATGLSVRAAFEQEFQLSDNDVPSAHALSFAALRRADPFAPNLATALTEAGIEPEVLIAEFGRDQFELTCSPAQAVQAADRAIAIREIVRETARNRGWSASFSPKTAPENVGSGVHIHFSLWNVGGEPVTHDPEGPGGLSSVAASFCAGLVRHLPGLTALSAPSVASYLRLRPGSWSASYTWLADRDREATLRICPVVTLGGRDPAPQFNIEYRAADATGNPYLALAGMLMAGLDGIASGLPCPPLFSGDPGTLSADERAALGLIRLPDSAQAAMGALEADALLSGFLPPETLASFRGVRESEWARCEGLDDAAICELYRALY